MSQLPAERCLNYLDFGYMYYGENKRRQRVDFSESLRERVKTLAKEMHLLYEKGKPRQR